MRNSRTANQLVFERLEHRRVLAGNVHVLINDSALLIVGDNLNNQIEVSQDAAGRFVITGLQTTTVNGGTSPFVVNGGSSHMTISMEGGADEVTVTGINVASNFSFFGGFGNDRLEATGLNARHFHGEGNPGNDVFILNGNIRKSAYLYLGAGDDVVSSDNLGAGRNLKVFGHGGNDTFSSGNLNVSRKLELHLGDGNDSALLSGETSVGRYARFNLGAGNDFAAVMPTRNGGTGNFRGFISVDANEGSNNVAFDAGVNVNGRLRTETGSGVNSLQLGGASFSSVETSGFANLQNNTLNGLIDQVFATLENVGIGVPEPFVPLEAVVSGSILNVTENSAAVPVDSGFSLTGSELVTGAEVRITNFVAGQDFLDFATTQGITGSFDAATGVMTLTGTASSGSYQTAIQSVQYRNTSDNPLTSDRQFNIVITNDNETANATRQFRVNAINDAPTVTPDNANQTINPGSPVAIDDLLLVVDPDSVTLVSAEVRFDSGFVAGEDVLAAVDSGGITSSYDAATGILGLTGNASLETWQTVLRSVTYDNSSSNPTVGARSIRISVNDGDASSSTVFQVNLQQATQPNTFDVQTSAANGTVVGQVTTTGTFQSPTIFQFQDSSVPADLLLNADDHLSGNVTASVVLIEYFSFQCPACASIHPVVGQLESNFSDDLLVVRRHLPLEQILLNAHEAAIFAEAAARQGMFEEMSDQLFTNQSEWSGVSDPTSLFEGYANNIGLDMTQLQTDVNDPALDERVTRDRNEAVNNLNITSTPTFVLQNQQIATPAGQTQFNQVIQDAIGALDNAFTINRQTGEIIVRDNALLNASNSPVTLSVLVADTSGNTETVDVTININP